MKRCFISVLIRLYPSRWRAEYGKEFSELLLRRPLGIAAVTNVVVSAGRQQLRCREPWSIVAVPMLVWMAAYLVLSSLAPSSAVRLAGKPTLLGIGIFFGVGFWTGWRRGRGGGKAAIKLSMIVSLPIFLLGILVMTRTWTPPGLLSAIAGDESQALMVVLAGPVLQIPYAGLIGWYGGLAARWARRLTARAV